MVPIKAVFFDVGETLIDETRMWSEWADWLGVSRHSFLAGLGAVIARGQHHHQVFELLRPGFDLQAARKAREAAGDCEIFEPADLYANALPCLVELRSRGYRIGVAGNQPSQAAEALRAAAVPADIIASSAQWGVEKPSAGFFARVIEEAEVAPREIAYVGDRLDNDVVPAARAGMRAVFLRRGPWGVIHAGRPEAASADLVIDRLDTLPDLLDGLSAATGAR